MPPIITVIVNLTVSKFTLKYPCFLAFVFLVLCLDTFSRHTEGVHVNRVHLKCFNKFKIEFSKLKQGKFAYKRVCANNFRSTARKHVDF